MNGPQHYAEAERLLKVANTVQSDNGPGCGSEEVIAEAQVHATLALTAATAYPAIKDHCGDEGDDAREWAKATAPTEATSS